MSVSDGVVRSMDTSTLSTNELEFRLRQASLSRPGSALRLRQSDGGVWEAAFTIVPACPVRADHDLPTWIDAEGVSRREALLALWNLIDQRPEFERLRRVRDR
jgi:hypothetical protein